MSKFLLGLSLIGCTALILVTPIDSEIYFSVVQWAQNIMSQGVIR